MKSWVWHGCSWRRPTVHLRLFFIKVWLNAMGWHFKRLWLWLGYDWGARGVVGWNEARKSSYFLIFPASLPIIPQVPLHTTNNDRLQVCNRKQIRFSYEGALLWDGGRKLWFLSGQWNWRQFYFYAEHVKNNEIKFRRQSWRHYQGMEINASSNEIKELSCMNEHS